MSVKVNRQRAIPWEQALDRYVFFKTAQGLAKRTLADARYHVSLFFRRTGVVTLDQDIRSAALEYFASTASMKPATYNTRRKALNAFFTWALSEGMVPDNPLKGIEKRKEDDVPRSVEEDVLRRLLELPDRSTFTGLRDYALILLTMDTGIRPGEACQLRADDFNLRTLDVMIPAHIAKTHLSRTLPLSPITVNAVGELLAARHPAWPDDTPVFCTQDGTMLSHNAWDRRMSLYSRRLGTKVQPYALRHSFALMYLRQGGNAFSLQKTLGHTTLAMTKRYVALTQQDLKNQHSVASPLRALMPRKNRVRGIRRRDPGDPGLSK